eukprot:6138768-Heterocapsa_arctica.AAC.1
MRLSAWMIPLAVASLRGRSMVTASASMSRLVNRRSSTRWFSDPESRPHAFSCLRGRCAAMP